MFVALEKINARPKPFQFYTASDLWADEHTSEQMLAFHLREESATHEVDLLDGFWSPNKYYGFQNTFKYDEEKVVLDKYTIIEPDRTREVYNWLQHFAPEDLEKEFGQAGFSLEGRYSDVAGTPYNRESSEFAVYGVRL